MAAKTVADQVLWAPLLVTALFAWDLVGTTTCWGPATSSIRYAFEPSFLAVNGVL